MNARRWERVIVGAYGILMAAIVLSVVRDYVTGIVR